MPDKDSDYVVWFTPVGLSAEAYAVRMVSISVYHRREILRNHGEIAFRTLADHTFAALDIAVRNADPPPYPNAMNWDFALGLHAFHYVDLWARGLEIRQLEGMKLRRSEGLTVLHCYVRERLQRDAVRRVLAAKTRENRNSIAVSEHTKERVRNQLLHGESVAGICKTFRKGRTAVEKIRDGLIAQLLVTNTFHEVVSKLKVRRNVPEKIAAKIEKTELPELMAEYGLARHELMQVRWKVKCCLL